MSRRRAGRVGDVDPGPTGVAPDSLIDAARDVRDEDAFDVAAVARWIRSQVAHSDVLAGLELGTDDDPILPAVKQFRGGASNLTYQLSYPGGDLILRRPPVGTKSRGAHDMRREHDVQAALKRVFPLVPEMVGFCDDESVIGSDFYVMERLVGVILRQEIPDELDPERTRFLAENAVDTLAELHSVDVAEAGLEHLGRGEGYVRRQISGWSGRFRKARTPDVPDFEPVMDWLDAHQPEDSGYCLIHNDFRLDNLVLSPDDLTEIVGVLDWEMATVGDPLMDLGGALAYWVQDDDDLLFRQFRRQPTHAPGMLTRDEVVARYCGATGRVVSEQEWRFYEVFGLFRLAVIAQQIHYRYFHGQTSNPAFKQFRVAVLFLEQRCLRIIRGLGTEPTRSSWDFRRPQMVQRKAGKIAKSASDLSRVVRPLAVHASRTIRTGVTERKVPGMEGRARNKEGRRNGGPDRKDG